MKKFLMATTVALMGASLPMSGTEAATLLGTFADNDCAGVFGIGANCNTGGTFTTIDGQQVTFNNTPLIAKLNPNGTIDQMGLFPSITVSDFSLSGNLGAGTVNYTYTQGAGDPAIQYVVVKGGDFFNVFGSVSNTDTVFAPLNLSSPAPNDRYGVSHISFYDTVVPPTTVPEPMSLALFGAGLLGLGMAKRRASKA